MSDQGYPPPPGSPPPSWTPPTDGPDPEAGSPPPRGAAHRPGAIALRPLGLGDMFDGAFRIMRFNPGATIGAALLVSAVAMALPVAITALAAPSVGTALDPATSGAAAEDLSSAELTGLLGSFGSLALGSVVLQIGLVLVTGLVCHVTQAAAVGERIGLGQAWARTHGKRWRLLGLVFVVGLPLLLGMALWIASIVALASAGAGTGAVVVYGLLSGLLFVVASVLYYVRCSLLAAVILMLEPVGIIGAVRRAVRLTSQQFWRVFGIALLTAIVAGVAGSILGLPFGLGGQGLALAFPEQAALVLVVAQALSTVLSAAFTAPFTAAVTTLQYLDQRMRKEAYDVELLAQAGITG